MKRWLFLTSFLMATTSLFAEGPKIPRHKDPAVQLEFENVYQDLRSVKPSSTTLPGGCTQYIQNGTTLQSGAVFNVSSGTVTGTTGEFFTLDGLANTDASFKLRLGNGGTGYSIFRNQNFPAGIYGDMQTKGAGATGSQGGFPLARSISFEGGPIGGNVIGNVFFTAAGGQALLTTQTSNPVLIQTNNVTIASFTAAGDVFMKGAVLGISISTNASLAQKTSTSGTYAETGLSMPYTTHSAGSTILVFASQSVGASGVAGTICTARLRRDGSDFSALSDQHVAINDSATEFDIAVPLIGKDVPGSVGTFQYGTRFARSGGTGTCIANTTTGAVGGNGGVMMIVEVETARP